MIRCMRLTTAAVHFTYLRNLTIKISYIRGLRREGSAHRAAAKFNVKGMRLKKGRLSKSRNHEISVTAYLEYLGVGAWKNFHDYDSY